MALIDDVKVALRISSTNISFNTEINDLINASKKDLLRSGIVVTDETDPLIKRCIVTYCKAYFGYDNPDADRLIKAYEMLKMHLMLSTEYNSEVVVDET
jgi:nicotinamide riboside kinase